MGNHCHIHVHICTMVPHPSSPENTESYNVHLTVRMMVHIVLHMLIVHISLFFILLQIITKIIAFRLKYFTHKFEVFDGIVVVVSWVLDVASMYVYMCCQEYIIKRGGSILLHYSTVLQLYGERGREREREREKRK